MSRYKAVVSYDGSRYVGWQTQKNGLSIQQVIEDVIEEICLKKVSIVASGRTDKKVHAKAQVFHFDSDFKLDAKGWLKAINGHLPKDIHISSLIEVDENFHARFHVIKKRYEYLINLGEYNVFEQNYAFQPYYKLDVEAMRDASAVFIGKHDFSTFCANTHEETPNQVRTITCLEMVQENEHLRLIFEGDGFMRYMVRMITATLIEVGRHRLSKEQVQKMLLSKDKQVCRFNAAPQGLYLVKVDYQDVM